MKFRQPLEPCPTVCHLLLCTMVVLFAASTISCGVHRPRWKKASCFCFPSSTAHILSVSEPGSTEADFVGKRLLSLEKFKACAFS